MELLTRNNFESWMQKLMERLDRQDELLLSLPRRILFAVRRIPRRSRFTAKQLHLPSGARSLRGTLTVYLKGSLESLPPNLERLGPEPGGCPAYPVYPTA